MTDEQRQYFDAMEATFQSLGWKMLTSDVHDWMAAIYSGLLTVSPDKLAYEQGRYAAFMQIAAFQQGVENAKASVESSPVNELEHYD